VFIRAADVTTAKFCFRVSQESAKCCELSRLFTYRPKIVRSPCSFHHESCSPPNRSLGPLSTRSKLGREEIKWQELLLHFRLVQAKHEKARRQASGADTTPFSGFSATTEKPADASAGRPTSAASRPPMRRKVTGEAPPPAISIPPRNALSPLNPRARQSGLVPSTLNPQSSTSTQTQGQSSKQLRTLSSMTRKP
jgi:hypothetical protein